MNWFLNFICFKKWSTASYIYKKKTNLNFLCDNKHIFSLQFSFLKEIIMNVTFLPFISIQPSYYVYPSKTVSKYYTFDEIFVLYSMFFGK